MQWFVDSTKTSDLVGIWLVSWTKPNLDVKHMINKFIAEHPLSTTEKGRKAKTRHPSVGCAPPGTVFAVEPGAEPVGVLSRDVR